jgi:hypothetical protein
LKKLYQNYHQLETEHTIDDKENTSFSIDSKGVYYKNTGKSTNSKEFLTLVNELIVDKIIWNKINEIYIDRDNVNNSINKIIDLLKELITEIDEYRYEKKYNCCP